MLFLRIACHAQTHEIMFGDDKERLETEFNKLDDLLKEGRFGKNRLAHETHRVSAPCGDVVVVLEKVELLVMIDGDKDKEIAATAIEERDNGALAKEIKWRKALISAGVAKKPGEAVPA